MFKLVSNETYERMYELSDEPKDKWPIFILKKLTAGEVNTMDDQLTLMKGEPDGSKISLLVGTGRRLKVKFALVDWRNVFDEKNRPVPCTDENKDKLPAEVQVWLEDDIDSTNKLRGLTKKERKNL